MPRLILTAGIYPLIAANPLSQANKQLLIEVDNELNFTRYFLPLTQSKGRSVDEIVMIIAAIMANGCNLGPDTMAEITPGVGYWQIKRITSKLELVSSFEIPQRGEGKSWAHPIVCNGRLYIRHVDHLLRHKYMKARTSMRRQTMSTEGPRC
ncbi:MAG: Tn3 family transposase, partial [bacterium]